MNALRDSDERTHLENADSTAAVCTTQTIHQNCNPSIHFLSPQAQPSVHSTNCSQSARVVSENEHAPPHLTHLHSQGYHGSAGGVVWSGSPWLVQLSSRNIWQRFMSCQR